MPPLQPVQCDAYTVYLDHNNKKGRRRTFSNVIFLISISCDCVRRTIMRQNSYCKKFINNTMFLYSHALTRSHTSAVQANECAITLHLQCKIFDAKQKILTLHFTCISSKIKCQKKCHNIVLV